MLLTQKPHQQRSLPFSSRESGVCRKKLAWPRLDVSSPLGMWHLPSTAFQ